jgi:hypothetical protein
MELGDHLALWIGESGLEVDRVTLRRYLVDEGYLTRDARGSTYRVTRDGSGDARFEPAIAAVNPVAVVRQARRDAARRKQATRSSL